MDNTVENLKGESAGNFNYKGLKKPLRLGLIFKVLFWCNLENKIGAQ